MKSTLLLSLINMGCAGELPGQAPPTHSDVGDASDSDTQEVIPNEPEETNSCEEKVRRVAGDRMTEEEISHFCFCDNYAHSMEDLWERKTDCGSSFSYCPAPTDKEITAIDGTHVYYTENEECGYASVKEEIAQKFADEAPSCFSLVSQMLNFVSPRNYSVDVFLRPLTTENSASGGHVVQGSDDIRLGIFEPERFLPKKWEETNTNTIIHPEIPYLVPVNGCSLNQLVHEYTHVVTNHFPVIFDTRLQSTDFDRLSRWFNLGTELREGLATYVQLYAFEEARERPLFDWSCSEGIFTQYYLHYNEAGELIEKKEDFSSGHDGHLHAYLSGFCFYWTLRDRLGKEVVLNLFADMDQFGRSHIEGEYNFIEAIARVAGVEQSVVQQIMNDVTRFDTSFEPIALGYPIVIHQQFCVAENQEELFCKK